MEFVTLQRVNITFLYHSTSTRLLHRVKVGYFTERVAKYLLTIHKLNTSSEIPFWKGVSKGTASTFFFFFFFLQKNCKTSLNCKMIRFRSISLKFKTWIFTKKRFHYIYFTISSRKIICQNTSFLLFCHTLLQQNKI